MTMELKLTKDYIAIKETENPFKQTKTESGILLVGSDMAMSEETGDMQKLEQVIGFGIVTITGPDAKTVKVGDGVYYDRRTLRPVPFNEPVWMFNEGNIVAYVQDDNGSIQAKVDEFVIAQEAEARKSTIASGGVVQFDGLKRIQ